MGKLSSLPDDIRHELIGYLAQPGIITNITAEVPKRKCDEFKRKYGVNPYPVNSEKKFGNQFRVYLADPEGCPDILKDVLDKKYSRFNDTAFIRELVNDYGFSFFQPIQDSSKIQKAAMEKGENQYSSFMKGFNTSKNFLSELSASIKTSDLINPSIQTITPSDITSRKPKKKSPAHSFLENSNAGLSKEQLLNLGWTGEKYLYKLLESQNNDILSPFGIQSDKSYTITWFNNGFETNSSWKDKSTGKGCDIIIKKGTEKLFIEVKTSRRKSPIFTMSSFEMQLMQQKTTNYFLVKIDYIEHLITGNSPDIRIFSSPFEYFFKPNQMHSAIFYCN